MRSVSPFPGSSATGFVEDSPNLAQLKGANVAESLAAIFQSKGIVAPVKTMNDADAVAAGLAVTQGRTDRWSAFGPLATVSDSAAIPTQKVCGRAVTWW